MIYYCFTNIRWFSDSPIKHESLLSAPKWFLIHESCTSWENQVIFSGGFLKKINHNIIASSLDVHKSFFPELCSLAVSTFKPFEQRFVEVNRHHPFRLTYCTYWKWWFSTKLPEASMGWLLDGIHGGSEGESLDGSSAKKLVKQLC